MEKINVLLTGASGAVGYEVLKQLVLRKDKFDITVFDVYSSKTEKAFDPYLKDIHVIYGDITHSEDIANACKNKDYVIHLAAIIPPKADREIELAEKVNVEGTRNLITQLENYSPSAFFAYSSSVSVYGDRVENPMIYTTDPLNPSPRDYYAVTKIKAEEIIRKSSLSWTIFRLSAIMGAGNHKLTGLMFHMPLNTPVEITTPKDTARAFVNAADKKEELSSKIFNLGGGEKNRIIYRNLLSENFKIFGLGKFNLPEKAFAEKNFHCGYYADGGTLERIVHFRHDTIQTYLQQVRDSVSPLQRFFTNLFSPIATRVLLGKSEPWRAYKKGDKEEMWHYFHSCSQMKK